MSKMNRTFLILSILLGLNIVILGCSRVEQVQVPDINQIAERVKDKLPGSEEVQPADNIKLDEPIETGAVSKDELSEITPEVQESESAVVTKEPDADIHVDSDAETNEVTAAETHEETEDHKSDWISEQEDHREYSSSINTQISEITIGSLPDEWAWLSSGLDKYADVFGVHFFATEGTPDAQLLHSVNVLAEYLDNNADGVVDNPRVLEYLVSSNASMIMGKDEDGLMDALDALPDRFHDAADDGELIYVTLFAEEVPPNNGPDASLEEILHLITQVGYARAYPGIFGERPGSDIANYMDVARGGHFAERDPSDCEDDPNEEWATGQCAVPPNGEYPDGAWYTYTDTTCSYDCMVTEYTYWALTSMLGAQSSRCNDIADEWALCTEEDVESRDRAVYDLLGDPEFALSTTIPVGDYRYLEIGIEGDAGVDTVSESDASTEVVLSEELVVGDEYYAPFTTYIDVKDVRIFGLADVAVSFVDNVGKAYEAMFKVTSDIDTNMQTSLYEVMSNKYVYQRVGYIGAETYGQIHETPGAGKYEHERVDYIWENPSYSTEEQTGEVIEHLLHTLTALGFHYAFPGEWSWDNPSSDLRLAVQEAIDSGHYDVDSYDGLRDDPEAYYRVISQEYAYWMIMAEWDYFDVIGMEPNEEWDISTPSEMQEELPLGHALYTSSVKDLITRPEESLMHNLFGR